MEERTNLPPGVLLPCLQDPAFYPHRPDRVELVQTHASYVALAPPYVYKVKKPVDFGFLDFSTLARRKHFCEAEVQLNRRLCPRIYLGVVPISRQGTQLTLEGDGQVVEYAVKMQQLEDGRFLHQLLETRPVTPADLDPVVDRLKAFYRGQTSTPEVAAWGRIEKLKISTDENFEQTARYVDGLLPRPTYEAVRCYTDRFYRERAALLDRRRTEGHILDCHGDLHTEHIHLAPEGVCIYDCIEFNDRFRYIDVASDVAFLAMDLDYHGRPDLSRYVPVQMAEALYDPDLLGLMDFYKCYRAYVRGKVACLRGAEPEVPEAEQQESRALAQRYFQLALRYAVAGSAPMVLVVMGRVGTGKSTQARALADLLGWDVVSSDRTRKQMAAVPLYERGDAAARAHLYAEGLTQQTYAALHDRAVANAGQGHGTILDATFSHPDHRSALQEALRQQQASCCFVELTASDEALRSRLRQREQAPRELSDARLEDFEMLTRRYRAPHRQEGLPYLTITTEQAPEATTMAILKGLIRLHLSADR